MPKSTLYAFLLSFFAGISTIVGSLIIFFDRKKESRVVIYALSFAAGVMVAVSVTDLLPNSYRLLSISNDILFKILLVCIFFVIGIIISMTIDKYVPDYNKDSRGLYKIGIISMIAIILHNIPEGIATFITSNTNIKLGITLSIAIALHNIPEGISISVPIYHATDNKFKAIGYSLISGMSEVMGSIIAYLFLKPIINDVFMSTLYAIIAGIMIHISIYELIPGAYDNGTLKPILKGFIIGFVIMVISHAIL